MSVLNEVRGTGVQSTSTGVLLLEKHDMSPIATGRKLKQKYRYR